MGEKELSWPSTCAGNHEDCYVVKYVAGITLLCVCPYVYYMYDQLIRYCSAGLPREPMRISVTLPSSVNLDAYASEQWEVQAFSLHSCFMFQSYIDVTSFSVML